MTVRLAKTASAQSDQSSLCAQWVAVQADLSLRWVHMPLRLFCHEAAQLVYC